MKIKNILIFILTICILLSATVCVSASEDSSSLLEGDIQDKMMRILASVEPEKENFALENVDFSSVTVGTSIPEYEVIDCQLVACSTKIFPVLSNGKMISQFFAWWDGEDWFVQLDNSLVEKTIELVGDTQFAYIYDREGVYVYSQGQTYLIGYAEQNDNIEDVDTIQEQTDVNDLSERGLISDLPDEYMNTIDCSMKDTEVNLDVLSYMENSPVELATENSAYLKVPIIKQPEGTHICWAIATVSIINYIYNYGWNYQHVVNLFNQGIDKGLPIKTVIANMNQHLNTNYSVGGYKPRASKIIKNLTAGYPIYGHFSSSDGAHAAVIRGCNKSKGTFSVMNPNPITNNYTAGTFVDMKKWYFKSSYSQKIYTLKNFGYRY